MKILRRHIGTTHSVNSELSFGMTVFQGNCLARACVSLCEDARTDKEGSAPLMETFWKDMRFALWALGNSPAFALIAVLALGLSFL